MDSVSLSESRSMDCLYKWQFYSAMTGRDWWGESGLMIGEVGYFEIPEEKIDDFYDAFTKFRKLYQDKSYYSMFFAEVDDSYNSIDIPRFKEAIRDILEAIVCD